MGLVYLWTGEGFGKTTNALGMALRCVGHKKKVLIIQFLKWWKNTGEYQAQKLLPNFEIAQFGREGWIGLSNLNDEDKKNTELGLIYANIVMWINPKDLLVLDEINLAAHCGLVDKQEVINFINSWTEKGATVVLTGQNAPQEFIDRADYVFEIKDVKHPKKLTSEKGVHY